MTLVSIMHAGLGRCAPSLPCAVRRKAERGRNGPNLRRPSKSTQPEIILPRKANFSRYIRDARIKRGLSVAYVASEVGVTGPCVYFWETGKARSRDANLSELCRVLKLPVRATRAMVEG